MPTSLVARITDGKGTECTTDEDSVPSPLFIYLSPTPLSVTKLTGLSVFGPCSPLVCLQIQNIDSTLRFFKDILMEKLIEIKIQKHRIKIKMCDCLTPI